MKPYSEPCERNKLPILNEIKSLFCSCHDVFEIGSGTGQHAVFFAEQLPGLTWHTSDRLENHDGILQWLRESALSNIVEPVELDVMIGPWPDQVFDAVFTANTCHIMHWSELVSMFTHVKDIISAGGFFVIYGPFNYAGKFTSESNAAFDKSLKMRDPEMGIRDYEAIMQLANANDFELSNDITMPANNRLLIMKRI